MKNLYLFVTFLIAFVLFVKAVNAQSVDDIINQYITARGGKDKLDAVKSLYLEGTRQMMGNEVDVKITRVQGKLSRVDFEVGGNDGYTIVTPDKGWMYIPMRSDEVQEIPAERLQAMQDQLDIAGPLVDYTAKGYKATLLGKDTVKGNDAWKIQLTDSAGKSNTYLIDTKTNLLVQTRVLTSMGMRNNNQQVEVVTDYSDYKDVDGVMFPQTITTEGSGMGAGAMMFDTIKINQPVDPALYKPSK
ncbi:MAG TPA: outer membrane lipoprotein-sorting protein [Chitinophagaceae bacterium]|nr:outer membrane lipoprotein-sorting protein [Chitinophagaceae bacterium]